ncbi:TATA-binding protein-associated factor mot1 [Dimargaris cristalligena]|nr:TATA-binding protein-associated factor mot1 [Dimargaris cristalligena]
MTSRLDRLILLLDTGSTSAIRATAAQQIGDIQKQHPQELANLLVRVARHLRSKQWETRVAAGLALEAIAQHVPEWCTRTDDDDRPSDAEEALSPPPSADGSVGTPHAAVTRSPTLTAHHASAWSFNRVDLPVVLAQGHSLLASAGKEYDFDLTDLDPAERMRLQRRRLAQNMGLGMQFDVGDLVEDADLNVTPTALHRPASVPIPPVVLRPGVAPTPTTAFHGAVPLAAIAPGASAIPPPGPRPRGRPRKHPPPPPKPTPLDDSVNPAYAHLDMTGLSARERNRLKRKAKKDGRTPAALNVITPDMQQGRDKMRIIESSQPSSGCPVPVAHRTPSEPSDSAPTSGNILDPDPTSEHSGPSQIDSNHSSISPSPRLTTPVPSSSEITSGQPFAVSSDHWPFTRIIDQLCLDLFDPDWEVRHGAGIGIKAILRKHGQSAARKMGCSPEVNDRRNQTYLLDIVVRIVCVLTLDRFCDFVSDQVVTPVRETCSQTLGTVCKFLSPEAVNEAMQALLKLVHQPWTHQAGRPMAMGRPLPTSPIWDVRYAGLLGLKYLVAVRQDLADQLLVGTVGAVHLGLQDSDDDVRAVSAATLIPMVDVLVTQLTAVVPGICRVLWDGLLELKDDLTPSIASVMELVSKLYRYEPVCALMKLTTKIDPTFHSVTLTPELMNIQLSAQQNGLAEGFESLIPRLYPFFRHTMTSVRQAVLETLLTFIRLAPHDPWVDDQWRAVDSRCLQLLYQNILLETHPRILQLSVEVWNAYIWRLVRCHRLAPTNQPPLLTQLIAPHLYHWLGWLVTPIGTPLSTTGMYSAPAPGHSKPRAGSAGLAEYQVHPVDTAMIQQDLGLVPIPVVFRNRTASARALGQCLAALVYMTVWQSTLGLPGGTPATWPLPDSTGIDDHLRSALLPLLQTGRGFHQWTIATVLEEWGTAYTACRTRLPAPHSMIWDARLVQVSSPAALLYNTLLADLNLPLQALRAPHQGVPYSELLPQLQRIYNDSVALLQAFIITARVPHNKIPGLPPVFRLDQPPSSIPGVSGSIFTAEIGQRVVTDVFTQLADSIPPAGQTKAAYRTLDEHRTYLTSSLAEFQEELVQLQTRVHCAAAGALVALEILPDKLNPIIRSLMNSVKRETLTDLQLRAAVSVTRLCRLLLPPAPLGELKPMAGPWEPPAYSSDDLADARPASLPVEKIIKNLCTCICSDPAATPALRQHMDREGIWSVLHPESLLDNSSSNGISAPDTRTPTLQTINTLMDTLDTSLSDLGGSSAPGIKVKCEPGVEAMAHPGTCSLLVPPLVSDMGAALRMHQGSHSSRASVKAAGPAVGIGADNAAEARRTRGAKAGTRGRARGRGRGAPAVSRCGSKSESLPESTPVTAEGENGAPDADSDGATPIPGAGDSAMAVTVRGATMALHQLATLFGPDLFAQLPRLWDTIARPLATVDAITASKDSAATDSIDLLNTRLAQTATEPASLGQELIDALQVIRTLVPALDSDLHPALLTLLPSICSVLRCQYMVIRFTTARCLASLAQVLLNPVLTATVRQVVPLLGHVEHLTQRQGAAEALYQIVTQLDDRILPFVIFLVVPVLGRMSDPDDSVRLVCTNGFAQLIKLVPLEAGVPDPPEMASDLLAHREHERKFLAQLMDSSQLEPFVIPVKISVTLRKYQQEGVSWLAFLNRYQLHGILCDDMGLGKTLQSICILASDHYHRAVRYAATKAPDSRPLASLVVCPPTLIGHWQQEILTYVDTLKPLIYAGPPLERRKLRPMFAQHDVIIMSYDVLRNDLDDLVHLHWNYCILDEGHVIKNTKTKITKAVKSVNALHRLILSGTPVQNNVVELWSLFDFLMPGFLGTERMFNDRYGKPILASRDSKSSSRDQEAGALALEALHKQVLPFLLRRMKEDVLSDLPPKIIQDYYCDLSDIQRQLYEDFSNSKTTQVIRRSLETGESYSALAAPEPVVQPVGVSGEGEGEGRRKNQAHVFQALQYLRKLVNHPLLVLNPKHAQYDTVMAQLRANQQQLRDLVHAPKLLALRQLLNDCGIGVSDPSSNTDSAVGALTEGAVSQHRALVFCQLKTMLDIVENDLLRVHMPGVTYMRLDGSVDSQKRQDVVTKFNQDPSIDLLLLTTHVGGLGLNLTGADTVIFIEHDWNPMKDLQAMDRAHRLGQKKVVNVYRLITRGTLEEKIMGLQKFKLNVANSIINQQNAGLQSMNTDQLLDLFSVSSTGAGANDTGKSDQGGANGDDKKPATAKNVLDNMDDLWDDRQYNEEYNLDAFIQSLN